MSMLNRYLHCTKAKITFIFETRCNSETARKRILQLPLCNYSVVPSQGFSGGLWLLWDDEVKVNVLKSTPHYIFAEVSLNDGNDPWGLAGIYGDPSRALNSVIWGELKGYGTGRR